MKNDIINRVIKVADYVIKTNDTIRNTATIFEVSKSTIHKDLKERLISIDIDRYNKIKKIMLKHLEERHIKGGEATRQLFLKKREVVL